MGRNLNGTEHTFDLGPDKEKAIEGAKLVADELSRFFSTPCVLIEESSTTLRVLPAYALTPEQVAIYRTNVKPTH